MRLLTRRNCLLSRNRVLITLVINTNNRLVIRTLGLNFNLIRVNGNLQNFLRSNALILYRRILKRMNGSTIF